VTLEILPSKNANLEKLPSKNENLKKLLSKNENYFPKMTESFIDMFDSTWFFFARM
jgi:hypothetical protein